MGMGSEISVPEQIPSRKPAAPIAFPVKGVPKGTQLKYYPAAPRSARKIRAPDATATADGKSAFLSPAVERNRS